MNRVQLPRTLIALATVWPWVPAVAQDPQAPEPVGSIPGPTIAAGQSVSFDLTLYFRDADGDVLAYAATVSDAAIAMVSVSDNILTVAGVASGTAVVTVFASDPGGLSAAQRTEVTIDAPNRAPEPFGTIPDQSLAPGQWISIGLSSYFSDPEGEVLSFSATTSNVSVAGVAVLGEIVTITQTGVGTAIVNAVARDPGGLSAQQSIPVTAGSDQPARDPARPETEPPVPAPLQRPQPGMATSETLLRYESEKRNEAVALLIEWFIPVVGHAYAGDAKAGLLPAGVTVGGLALVVGGAASCLDFECEGGAAAAVTAGLVATASGRIWGIVSAYRTAGKTNRELRQRLGLADVVGSLTVMPDPMQGRYRVGMALRF